MRDRMRRRLRALFRRRDMEREMDEEMRFHVEMEARELVHNEGLEPTEARRRALVAFGGRDRALDEAREIYIGRWLEDLMQDARHSLRMMRRTPGFSLVAVLTLALGIGATTAIFSVVDGALLRPLPYRDSDMLVSVWSRFLPESGFDFEQFPLSPPEYLDYREHTRALDDMAALNGYRATVIQSDGSAIPTRGVAATANLFDVLGVRPSLGRVPTEAEAVSGGTQIVVLGHALWRRAFFADSACSGVRCASMVARPRSSELCPPGSRILRMQRSCGRRSHSIRNSRSAGARTSCWRSAFWLRVRISNAQAPRWTL